MHIDDEDTAKTAKATVTFDRLRENVLELNGTSLDTKLKVRKALILQTLLYECKTWTVYQPHLPKDLTVCIKLPEKILKNKMARKIPNTKVLMKAGMQSVYTLLKRVQLRWNGHVAKIPDE